MGSRLWWVQLQIDRHGKAAVLSAADIQLLFERGFQNSRDRCLFSVALFSGARINEVCSLLTNDVYNTKAAVRSHLIIRKGNTKRQLAPASSNGTENSALG
jgi:site-specific recombinase XerD